MKRVHHRLTTPQALGWMVRIISSNDFFISSKTNLQIKRKLVPFT
ncbi:unnamed protein product [Tenebrio molitor]|nr:unnamed protein product [Tenebrio molitor]